MKSIVPYTKEITFDGKLAEICSISLEPEININDVEIIGNFIVSGEYKSHQVSVNKESFSYKLPFSVDVTDSIVKDSIEFEVTDFTYEIIGDDTLKVDIEFSVSAEEKREEQKNKEESEINREAIVEEINDFFLENDLEEDREEIEDSDLIEQEEIQEIIEEIEEKNEESEEIGEERLDQESAELILDSATAKEDEYTTYYIHLVKQGDTLESIIANYQTDLSTLKKYNILDTLNIGDKIIIPSLDE